MLVRHSCPGFEIENVSSLRCMYAISLRSMGAVAAFCCELEGICCPMPGILSVPGCGVTSVRRDMFSRSTSRCKIDLGEIRGGQKLG